MAARVSIYRAALLASGGPSSLWHVPDGALVVGEDGRIVAACAWEALPSEFKDLPSTDLRPCWILPGLVDLHTHLPQYRAVAMDGLELMPWLRAYIYPTEMRFMDPAHAVREARRFFHDLLSWGTTTAVAYATIHARAVDAAFAEAERAGMRAVLGKVMMDRHSPAELTESTEASLIESEELCSHWHGRDHGRLSYAFSPRFAGSCSPELMCKAGALAEKCGAYVQTHLAESRAEVAWMRELFPSAADYTSIYAHAGLLGPRTLLGHGVYLSGSERAQIREAGATIVHCARANAFLKSGVMPLRRWLAEGLSVGLGTDVGAGPSLSLWDEMGFACQASRLRAALLPDEDAETANPTLAFHLATQAGALALGMDDRIGDLRVGKEADFIIVDPRMADPAGEIRQDPAQVLSRLLYREDPRMIRASHVRGRACFTRED